MKPIYVDNNATTQVAPKVLEAMLPYFREYYGNPSSMHTFGGQVGPKIREAREQVAELVGANADEILFTSCGSESDNTAIHSALTSNPEKRHIVISRVEHPAIRSLVASLSKQGYRISEIPVDSQGHLNLEKLQESLTQDTAIVSIMWANNETGVIFPIEKIAEMVHRHGIIFHTDAVQAVGKIPVNLRNTTIDMLSLSGHKLHAAKGIGALFIRKGTKFSPFLIGGHQERGRRAGTENVPGIIGLGAGCQLAKENMDQENSRVRKLRNHLEKELLYRIPNSVVNGDPLQRLPNTSNISFEFVEGESILLMLNEFNICASSGSACTSGSLEPSHVIRAMGVPFTMAHGSIRFSLSIYNTREEVDFIIEKLPPVIERLRLMSPFGNQGNKACTLQ